MIKKVVLFIGALVSLDGWKAMAQEATVVQRFVLAVQNASDLNTTEFAGTASTKDTATLAALAKCTPGAPRTGSSGSILIMWDCSRQNAGSVGTMLSIENDKVSNIYVMGAVIVRTKTPD